MTRLLPWAAAAVLVGAMAAPALVDPPTDGFPLSTYPMFAVDRGATTTVVTAVGRTGDGGRTRLSPHLLAGTDEPILAVRTARAAVERGDAALWCDEIAQRVATASPAAPATLGERSDAIVGIEVVSERHDARASIATGQGPIDSTIHATCLVDRP